MKRVFIASCGVLVVLSGCGIRPESNRSSAHAPVVALAPPEQTSALAIPLPTGPSDHRGPLERLLGVPANPDEAAAWDFNMMARGEARCMIKLGWDYTVVSFDQNRPGNPDPNLEYFRSLSAQDQARYSTDRWGAAPASQNGGCQQQASDTSHLMNTLPTEFKVLTDSIDADTRMRALVTDLNMCVGSNANNSSAVARCQVQTRFEERSSVVVDEYETAFIHAHVAQLTDFLGNRP